MGSSDPKPPPPAFMYDVDDDGNPIKGSKRSARKKEDKESKDKSRPKVSHRRSEGDKKLPKSDSGVQVGYPAKMTGARQDDAMVPREIKVERRRSHTESSRRQKDYQVRSPSKSRAPRTRDDTTYFGIPPQTAVVPTPIAQPLPYRPHAVQSYQTRPSSYHPSYPSGSQSHGPPISNPGFWQPGPAMSYPPVAPSATFMQNGASPSEYFPPASPVTSRSLSSRFGPPRTASGFGFRAPVIQQQMQHGYGSYDGYEDEYMSAAEGPRTRPTIRIPTARKVVRTKAEVDYEAMPPPPRPASARPGPGPSILRRSGEYYADVTAAPEPQQFREPQYREPPQYREREREHDRDSRPVYREERAARRPPSVSRPSYDYPDHRVEAANSSRRRDSYYGPSTSTGSGTSGASGWEDKAAQATSYQADVSGAAPAPLTTDLLRRQQRHQGGSTRSTKSSGSRDESDYRKSATTRTTRSGSSPDDENVTIKVTGQATVTVGGAQINCEGGEIEIKRQKSLRNASEWSNSEYGDDTRQTEQRRIDDRASRIDKPAGRSNRRSISYSRPSPQFAHGNFI